MIEDFENYRKKILIGKEFQKKKNMTNFISIII